MFNCVIVHKANRQQERTIERNHRFRFHFTDLLHYARRRQRGKEDSGRRHLDGFKGELLHPVRQDEEWRKDIERHRGDVSA